MYEFDSRQGQNFSLLQSIQIGYEAHPLRIQWGHGAVSLRVNWPGQEADHSSSSSAEVKNGVAIPPLPHMSSRLVGWLLPLGV
jgi:hypothetical protein